MAGMDMIGGDVFMPGGNTLADEPKLPEPKTPEEAALLPEGAEYMREGKKFSIPYRPKDPSEAAALPEGSLYITPDGQQMRVPKYEHLDFTTQTLYNMAVNDKERRKALERGYPGKVKDNKITGEVYVDDDGTFRRSRGFVGAPGAFVASQAAPVLGSIVGEVGGGVAGAPGGPPGIFGGAVAGGAAGGAAGQGFNDAIMALAGVYDRLGGEEAEGLTESALFGGGGTAVGRTAAAAMPAVKSAVGNVLPRAVNYFLGTDPEKLAQGSRLREKGTLVPTSGMFPEAPHIANVVEVFDPAFHMQDPLRQSAEEHMERESRGILGDLGVKEPGKIVKPEAAVSTEAAGGGLLGRTRNELRKADEELRAALQARHTELSDTLAEKTSTQGSQTRQLEEAATNARNAAQKVIDAGFEDIDKSAKEAMAAVKAGHNSGDLWQQVAEKIKKMRAGIVTRAEGMYTNAETLAGGIKPDISGLTERAQAFLEQLPEGFEGKYPAIVKQIRDMAGEVDQEGKVVKEPVQPTWAQLHNLRSILRMNYNRLDLTPDIKQGTFKFFQNRIDEILNAPLKDEKDPLYAAAKALREADTFYRENMGAFNDKRIQAVMDGLDAGLPADPKVLFDTIVKEGRSDLTKKVADMVGPNLWAGVKAADTREMLDQSKGVTGAIDGRRFVSQVLERYRSGMLEAVHGKDVSRKLLEQAQNIETLAGRLDIPVRPGDTISDVINNARSAADAAKAAAKQDPLGTLTKEIKTVESKLAGMKGQNVPKEAIRQLQGQNKDLAFLYDPSVGATQAVDKILGSEDLIIATASKFGPDSQEFNALRQVWAQRLLSGTLSPSERLGKVSEEVQRLMFPGTTLDQMKTLAKDMDFLMARKKNVGTSMISGGKVEHPLSSLPRILGTDTGKILNVATLGLGDPAARAALSAYYKLVRNGVNNPAFLRWLEKGLKGDDGARETVRDAVRHALSEPDVQKRSGKAGATGAGIAQSQYQTPNQPDAP
jgi:hypothetical protein